MMILLRYEAIPQERIAFFICIAMICGSCLLSAPQSLPAQTAADSLLLRLRQSEKQGRGDTELRTLLNETARALYMRSPDSAQSLAGRALKAASRTSDTTQIAFAHNVLGLVYLDKALYDKALEELLLSLRLYEIKCDTLFMAKLSSNIGNLYGQQHQLERALEYYRHAIAYYQRIGNTRDFIGANSNIGFTYWKQGKYDLALEYHRRSLQMAQEQHIPSSITIARVNLGATYLAKRKFDSAAFNLDDALRLALEQTNNRAIAITLHYKSFLAYQIGRFATALPLAQEALEIATRLNAREERGKNFKLLADIYAAEGRYKEAFETERRHEALKDSLFNLDNTKAIANLQALYTSEKKDAEIQLLKRDADIQALELRRQTTFRNSLGVGVVGLLVLAGILANRYWLKQRSEKALQDKNAEILRQQEILEDQASEIELVNSELHESNIKLLDANDELQKTYQEILRQQQILEEQAADIEENNTKLHESNIALQRLDQEKSELLGIVAHDLKNPLGSIIVNAGTLHRYQETVTPAQVSSIAGRIVDVGSRMRDILEDLLNLNAIETGAMTVRSEAFNISELTQMVLENYRSAAEGKFLSLHFASDTPAMLTFADKGKTEEVLDNLISNAVKYSPQGKNVFVRVGQSRGHWSLGVGQSRGHSSLVIRHLSDENSPHPTDKSTTDQLTNDQLTNDQLTTDYVRIEVQDEGQGLSAEDMSKLFSKFTRLTAQPTGGETSTGLGLSIVKKLVEAMNGKVWCESELGNGATFIVELPIYHGVQTTSSF